MPNSLLQAMAAARPVAAVDVGDLSRIVAPENRPLVVPRDRPGAMAEALAALAGDAPRRQVLGRLNQERVKAEYSLGAMIAAYRALLGARGGAAGNASLRPRSDGHTYELQSLMRISYSVLFLI